MPLTVTVQQAPATGKEYTLNDTDGLTLPGGESNLWSVRLGAPCGDCAGGNQYILL
jgi:hypothetical protein